ncbi:MAG TPA: glycosyltransferase family 9 protein [Chthoniobacteraceae bacterium]|jgi:heptosyltransferase-2|nr:glycosyltransferase family 9 protein [Chthoniobacteraceae bacterium]
MKPRILVIRGGAIGDFVLTLPAIRLLRENFPHAHLEILGYKHIVALAEGRFYADATRSIEYGGLSRFFIPGAELPEDLVEYFASFQQIVSYLYDPDGFFAANLRRSGVRYFIHGSPMVDDSAHAAQQLALPLESLALYLDGKAPALFPTEADRLQAGAWLADAFPGAVGPLIALHPGSGGERKNWPAAQWAALGETIFQTIPDARLLLVGGEADHGPLALLRQALRGRPAAEALDLPLPHLAAILQRARLFLGHDSGISHIAAAVGVPALLLFGPTDPDIWAPPAPGVRILRAPENDLARLRVETVAEALGAVLQGD